MSEKLRMRESEVKRIVSSLEAIKNSKGLSDVEKSDVEKAIEIFKWMREE